MTDEERRRPPEGEEEEPERKQETEAMSSDGSSAEPGEASGDEETSQEAASETPADEEPNGERAEEESDELLANVSSRIEVMDDEEAARFLRRLSRRGFLAMAAAGGAGYIGWKWLQTRPLVDGRPWPLRRTLELNEKIARAWFDTSRLSPTFPPDRIDKLRANGKLGLTPEFDLDSWRLRIEGVENATGPIELTLDAIREFPAHEMITELRCIEGWSIVQKWKGIRLVDLMKRYPPPTRDGSAADPVNHPERLVRYVAMETPDKGYYVGLDMPSAIHPQTLLVWAMNDRLLNWLHGAPLRLAIPVKYGVKNLKRIGTIRYTDVRPPDFWGKRGYDWYAGF